MAHRLENRLEDFLLGPVGEEEANVSFEVARHAVQVVLVLALWPAPERHRNDLVLAEQELAVRPARPELFEEDVALIEHGDDEQVVVLVKTFPDLAEDAKSTFSANIANGERRKRKYLGDEILLELETLLLGHGERNLKRRTRVVSVSATLDQS